LKKRKQKKSAQKTQLFDNKEKKKRRKKLVQSYTASLDSQSIINRTAKYKVSENEL